MAHLQPRLGNTIWAFTKLMIVDLPLMLLGWAGGRWVLLFWFQVVYCNYVVCFRCFPWFGCLPDMIVLPKWFLMVKKSQAFKMLFSQIKTVLCNTSAQVSSFPFSQHRICRLPRTGFGRHWRWPRHAISREAQRLQLSRQHPGWVGGVNSVWCSHRYRFFLIENTKRRWTFLSYVLSTCSTYIHTYIHIYIYHT